MRVGTRFFEEPLLKGEAMTAMAAEPVVAYFSMEVALEPDIPTYSGGLGILAGDTLRAAADLGVPLVAVSLLYREGYFTQRLDEEGNQSEEPTDWDPRERLKLLPARAHVEVEGRTVAVQAWEYIVTGASGHTIRVYLLDTGLEENDPQDRAITDQLYGGDERFRLCQETVLGLGGLQMLDKLGLSNVVKHHMNEGHSALLALGLMERAAGDDQIERRHLEGIGASCVFTTHTPVPAGHDRFPRELVEQVLGGPRAEALERVGCLDEDLNMTELAMEASDFINGVAMSHGEISQEMFPDQVITAITNGVHVGTWTSPPMARLFDEFIPAWRRDNTYLRHALGIPIDELYKAHNEAKSSLLEKATQATGVELRPGVLTIGFARRATAYKRADLIFTDIERLRYIARNFGPFQIIFAGKAHPRDEAGKDLIRRVFEASRELADDIPVAYVENYDWRWGQALTSGVDLWLNTPRRPQEASGTSGMKAALNGVPSLSILDGWWVEGYLRGITGWAIGHGTALALDSAAEAASLYGQLENSILPLFYGSRHAYGEVMRSAIAVNGSFFSARRMVSQYVANAYVPQLPHAAIVQELFAPRPKDSSERIAERLASSR